MVNYLNNETLHLIYLSCFMLFVYVYQDKECSKKIDIKVIYIYQPIY